MADIVVKNGFNGFNNNKNHNKHGNSQRKQISFNNKLPPLETYKDNSVYSAERSQSPVLQPSLSDRNTTSSDFVILLDDEVRRIHRLSVNLGITHHYEVAEYQHRFDCRRHGRLPKIQDSKYWRQSHNWTKRMEGANGFVLRRNGAVFGKHFDTSSVDFNSLPRGRKKLLEPVEIPALGCSYRLPVLKKHIKQKTGR